MAYGGDIRMKPSQIRFSQATVYYAFHRHTEDLNESIEECILNRHRILLIPQIQLVIKNRKIYTVDNRRLYLFRVLERHQCVTDIQVSIRQYQDSDYRKFTTTNDGESIAFHGKRRSRITPIQPFPHGSGLGIRPDILDLDVNEATKSQIEAVLLSVGEVEWTFRSRTRSRQEHSDPTVFSRRYDFRNFTLLSEPRRVVCAPSETQGAVGGRYRDPISQSNPATARERSEELLRILSEYFEGMDLNDEFDSDSDSY